VTLQDLRTIIRKYYSENDLKIVIVGSEKKFRTQLQSLGNVVIIPLDKVE
jgi:hypothetical protein